MSTQTRQRTAQPNPSRASRARRLLTGVGIAREDSDDELGLEDHPWEWVYEGLSNDGSSNKENEVYNLVSNEDSVISLPQDTQSNNKKRKLNQQTSPRIIAARMGGFQCKIGDSVLLKAEGTNEAWVGIICEFQEAEENATKLANIMWFSTEKEIKNKQKKRTDFMQVSHPMRHMSVTYQKADCN